MLWQAGISANAQSELEQLFSRDIHESVRTEAIKAYCKIGSEEIEVLPYLNHRDDTVTVCSHHGHDLEQFKSHSQAGRSGTDRPYLQFIHGTKRKRRIAILKEVANIYSHPEHDKLIDDHDYQVADAAIRATGTAVNKKALNTLFAKIAAHEKSVFDALYNAGESSVVLIKDQLESGSLNLRLQDKLITLLGKIGGPQSIDVLINLLSKRTHTTAVVRALHRCKYSADRPYPKRTRIYCQNISHFCCGITEYATSAFKGPCELRCT